MGAAAVISAPVVQPNLTEVEANIENLLMKNQLELSGWARRNFKWTAALIYVESRGRLSAVSHKDAQGLMQVIPPTARQIYETGYTRYKPTNAVLHTAAGGIYYGTAYLEMMSKINPDRDWITRAYNGGPGWQRSADWAKNMTAKYLHDVRKQFIKISRGSAA